MEMSPSPYYQYAKSDGFATPIKATDSPYVPALSSYRALARFEFEPGRGNEGTKILMVEWLDEDGGTDWQVSWEGKTTVLPAKDIALDKSLRIYFLLASGAMIPRIVKISRIGAESHQMQTNPLPAIFPPGLCTTTPVRKGVLHNIWARKRLSALQEEIELEMRNGEGVGLEMALQERQWILDNFGSAMKIVPDLQYSMIPSSLRTAYKEQNPYKFNEISSATDASKPSTITNADTSASLTLSQDTGDFAVPAFSLFESCGQPISENPTLKDNIPSGTLCPHNLRNSSTTDLVVDAHSTTKDPTKADDDLFALKLSPRTPNMKRSPFCGNL